MVVTMLICICAGFGYAWSVFQNPLIKSHGWTDSLVSLTFTINVVSSTLTSLFLGSLIKKAGIRKSVLGGAVLFGVGMFLSGIITGDVWELYVFYGFMTGVGVGLIYPPLMSYVVRLFPDKTGLASGLGTAAYGSGAIIWAPVATSIINGADVGMAFRVFGIGFFVLIAAGSFVLKEPPQNFMETKGNTGSKVQAGGLTRLQMVKTPAFYLMLAVFSFALVSGIMVISQASSILQLRCSFESTTAAVFVSVFSAANMAGRFIWGSLSDKIGNKKAVMGILAICVICMALMAAFNQPVIVIILMALTASCYGGAAAIVTPMTAEVFGPEHITENYGVMYVVFGIAGLIGPLLASALKDAWVGGYTLSFVLAAVIAVVGLVITFVFKFSPYKNAEGGNDGK